MLCGWGNLKGSRTLACRDFDGIYPTAPIFMPKTRKVQGERGLGRGGLLPGRGCCGGGSATFGGADPLAGSTLPPDTCPIRAAIRAANKPLAISLLIGAG